MVQICDVQSSSLQCPDPQNGSKSHMAFGFWLCIMCTHEATAESPFCHMYVLYT